ncbi:MAG: hypothetical protein H6624_01615 [Bdellovibrionaceae bacterium]|nr:hypothetical protein [Bdellovibrionales bacterium]MCB9083005.1 hypothetical protein [Pseudobdellovibrionaceae bacterium]
MNAQKVIPILLFLAVSLLSFASWAEFPMSVGGNRVCYSTKQGFRCFGANKGGDTYQLPSDASLIDLATGYDHVCYVTQRRNAQSNLLCPIGHGSAVAVNDTKDWGVISKVAAGPGITCGIFDKKRIRCLGGLTTNLELDEPFDLGVGHGFGCALDKKGVHCFGQNSLAPMSPSSRLDIKDPTALAVGSFHACVIDDGKVKCWGSNAQGQTKVPGGLKDPIAVSAGLEHTCAIDSLGLHCWGKRGMAGSWAHGDNPYLYISSHLRTNCRIRTDQILKCYNAPETLLDRHSSPTVYVHPLVLATNQLSGGIKSRQAAFDHLRKFLHRPDGDFLAKLKIWELQNPEMDLAEQELFHFLALNPYFKYSGYSLVRERFYPHFEETLAGRIQVHGLDQLAAFANGRSLKAYLRSAIRFLFVSLTTLPAETRPELVQSMDQAVRGLGDALAEAEDLNQWKLTSILKFQQEVAPLVDEISKSMLEDPLLHSRALSQQMVLEFVRGI